VFYVSSAQSSGEQTGEGTERNDGMTRVESRTGAVTIVSRWIFDVAFAAPPQSGLAWFCFLFPLIEPDRQISRIRLSEKTHDVPCDAVCNF
jgi:hypothetical protein